MRNIKSTHSLVESINTKGHMKSNSYIRSGQTSGNRTSGAHLTPRKGWKTRVGFMAGMLMVACAPSLMALTITPLGKGTLPTGEIILTLQVRLEPGDVVPWHYHTGPGSATMLSGTLTEDEGCGTALKQYSAGQAFTETPGRVHMVYNAGTVAVVLLWTETYGACYDATIGWTFVNGPTCAGVSGRSLLANIPDCQ
jgi:quercetin dioxygenase-like cupin family protein